jgi:uncharacterized membrane protein YecN with MAPEG domain
VTRPLLALLGYVVWDLALVVCILLARGGVILRGEKKINEFPSGVPHGGDRYWRLNRAHANVVENLPVVGALVLIGTAAHVHTPLYLTAPLVALGARVVQTVAHVSSGSAAAVSVRFTGFAAQLVCFAVMIVEIARTAL